MLLLHQTVVSHSAVDAKQKIKEQWASINWESAYDLVKSLQRRIVAAVKMRDRAMQALYLLALEPIAETKADRHSYGFRPYRSCHDALEQCHILLSRKDAPEYILEGDIKSCFDKISHDWILNNIPMDKRVLSQWLKAGIVENKSWFPSDEGTPPLLIWFWTAWQRQLIRL